MIPGGDVPDPDPLSLLARISKAVCKYVEEGNQRALSLRDIENYHWIFETLVPKYMFKRSLWGTRDKEALAHEIRLQNQKIAFEALLEEHVPPVPHKSPPLTTRRLITLYRQCLIGTLN